MALRAALVAAAAAGLISVSSSISSSPTAYSCSTSLDCENLGTCDTAQHVCVCHPGFTGPSCGTLDLAPAPPSPLNPVWPRVSASPDYASAWGWTMAFDPSDGLYHGVVTVACGADGVIGDGGGLSWIAHVSSPNATGPFSFRGVVVPQTSFGPHLTVSPDGSTYVLIFRVNLFNDTTLCGGNSSVPLSPADFPPYIPHSAIAPGDPEHGTNIFIAWAPKMTGPWSVVRANITGGGDGIHKSNPSLTFLRDGRVLMAYRYNSKVGELNAIAFADKNDFRGPYTDVFNLTNGKPGDEDPFVWEQPDGSLHVIWHNQNHGFHAFATNSSGAEWRLTPIGGTYAFQLGVEWANGTSTTFLRRERPEIRFNADGTPAMLYNGVTDAYATAWVLGQPFVQQ
jgi:hypothetical protein